MKWARQRDSREWWGRRTLGVAISNPSLTITEGGAKNDGKLHFNLKYHYLEAMTISEKKSKVQHRKPNVGKNMWAPACFWLTRTCSLTVNKHHVTSASQDALRVAFLCPGFNLCPTGWLWGCLTIWKRLQLLHSLGFSLWSHQGNSLKHLHKSTWVSTDLYFKTQKHDL